MRWRPYFICIDEVGNLVRWRVRLRGTTVAAGTVDPETYGGEPEEQLNSAYEWAWNLANSRRRELLTEGQEL